MIDAPLALAFTTGMVATVNPCGFAMLPGLPVVLRRHREPRRGRPACERVAGAGGRRWRSRSGSSRRSRSSGSSSAASLGGVYDVAPWISLVIGAALVVLGIALLAGFELNLRLPRLDRGGRTRGLASMALFGVSYAVASLGCELPIFLAAISGVFGRGLASGAAYFVAFALGFGVVLVSLTVTLAMARQSMVHSLRRCCRS